MISRRRFCASIGATAIAGRGVAGIGSRPAGPRRIGWLGLGQSWSLASFRDRLRELGWVEGSTLTIEARWANNDWQRLPELASDLVTRRVDVIVTQTTPAAIIAAQATRTIPVVMAGVADPVDRGIVRDLARPGGNVTGILHSPPGMGSKLLQLLRDAAPQISRVALLDQEAVNFARFEAAALRQGLTALTVEVRAPNAIPEALQRARDAGIDGMLVPSVPVNEEALPAIIAFTRQRRIPSIGASVSYARGGGLMSYWASWADVRRRAGDYVDRILRGANPGDLPIVQPDRYELVINLATAKELGLAIPPSLRIRADEIVT